MAQRTAGFTLWELLCTLAIAAVLLTAAAPLFSSFLLDARLTADVNAFVLAVQLARSEAAKRGAPVIVCPTRDHLSCGTRPDDYTAGWMVFVNVDDALPPARAAAEPLLYAHAPASAGAITANRPFFELRADRRSTNGTAVFCDARGTAAAKAVIVSYTGRPRVDRADANGQPLRCARLT